VNRFPEHIENSQAPPQPTEQEFDIQGLLLAFLRNWYWILLCLILGFVGARLYLRYTHPVYLAKGTILIKGDPASASGALSEEAVLQELGVTLPNVNVINEIQILKSRSLMMEVVRELGLDIRYIGEGRIMDTEYYSDPPVRLDTLSRGSANLAIRMLDDRRFTLYRDEVEERTCTFGEPFVVDGDTFQISRRQGYGLRENLLKIQVRPAEVIATNLLRQLTIKPVEAYSNVLSLEFKDRIPARATDILNTLVEVYNQATIDDKNQVARKTIAFVDERLRLLTAELSAVEGDVENYKERNEIPTEAAANVSLLLSQLSASDSELATLQIRQDLLDAIEASLTEDTEKYELIPANTFLIDAGELTTQIERYNTLLLERERLLRSAGADNPLLRDATEQLAALRVVIVQSIRLVRQSLELSIGETRRKLDQLQQRIGAVPRQERELLEIKRQQNIKESLYLFLLQKKEETALSSAVTVANARVIDAAIPERSPISPNPMQAYAFGLMLGLALPVGVIFLRQIMNDKIYTEEDIKAATNTPLAGVIMQNQGKENIVVQAKSRTAIAEMFRMLRTNLNYLAAGGSYQTILITSGMGSDGKTFLATNLGMSLALSGKRTVVVGVDLRKPRVARYLTGKNDHEEIGLTNYLVDEMPLESIIHPTDYSPAFFYIPSGPIPPNPAELLDSPRVRDLFANLSENFDHIIIDTAPVLLVTDAYLLSEYADITLFPVRFGQTPQWVLKSLEEIRKEQKMNNPAIVLNGVKKGKGYGYGYGQRYSYYEEETRKGGWLNFW